MTREEIEKCFSYHAADAALQYYEQEYLQPRINESRDVVDAFEAGAEWAHKRLVHNACEWLKEYMYIEHIFEYSEDEKPVHYVCASACDSVDEFINEFKKAMEE